MLDEKLDNKPIWQNHEQRITALEVTMTGLSSKMDSVENMVKEGNNEQKKILNTINNRMKEEFFYKKLSNHDNNWQILGKVLERVGLSTCFLNLLHLNFRRETKWNRF
ncbi:MAG TPA: hypothetical protein DEO65_11755 [Bacillus bacterium]|uniref:Uncharacterized protein n=1 Tax=Siminovitchia fordii TaxID=254759 RepID=A0ABQ4K967_9BACI|nr:hypothetical protein [Siminovitchia fordii]GIN21403.1 hypothetical protein J1TS3_25370 [Siminovitchia fordii]HBZ10539.1 hypothetical protein [Bacillus sp. (in: firmicutes)]